MELSDQLYGTCYIALSQREASEQEERNEINREKNIEIAIPM